MKTGDRKEVVFYRNQHQSILIERNVNMKTNEANILLTCIYVSLVIVLLSLSPDAIAQDTCSGTGNCDITGEYQINSNTVLKVSESAPSPSQPLEPRDIFIGNNAGALNPVSSGPHGTVLIGGNAGSSLTDTDLVCGALNPTKNVRGTTIIGDDAAKFMHHSMHNTIVGAGANGLVCDPALTGYECPDGQTVDDVYHFSYNTIIGGLAGRYNIGSGNTFVGVESGNYVTTGSANVLLGLNAGAGHERLSGGSRQNNSLQTGSYNVFIGEDTEVADSSISSSIALGPLTRVEADHQIVVGSGQYLKKCVITYGPDCPEQRSMNCSIVDTCTPVPGGNPETTCELVDYGLYTDSYWGSGVTSVDPQSFSFNASGGEGLDVMGANLHLAAGRGTGAADGGYITLQTTSAGASGTNQNTLQDRLIIAPNGNVGIGPAIPQAKLDVQGNASISTVNAKRALVVDAELNQDGVVAGNFIEGALYQASLSGSSTGYVFGMRGTSILENTAPTAGMLVGATFTNQIGNTSTPGTTTADEVIGFQYTLNRHFNNQRTYSITNSYGIQSRMSGGSTSGAPVNITNHYHHFLDDSTATSMLSITNQAGVWINHLSAGTNNYGIVLDGDGAGADIVFGPNNDSSIYSDTGELFAEDAAGNVTQISPHDPETGEWIFYSKNTKTGRSVRVNMEELVKDMEKLTGKKYLIESFVKDK
jgi:hypothetical protein